MYIEPEGFIYLDFFCRRFEKVRGEHDLPE
jgi:hypothetical protein